MTAALFDPSFDTAPPRLRVVAAPPSPHPTLAPEVYRRRRLGAVAVAIGLVLGLASFGRQADATPTAAARSADAVVVVVQPGDTLWGIAASLAPGSDPRPLVAALGDLTDGSSLQPGQQLVIPGHLLD